jgi:hypothetical protein
MTDRIKHRITDDLIDVSGLYVHVNGCTYLYELEIQRNGGDTRLTSVTLWDAPEIPVTKREILKTLAHAAEHMRSSWIEDGTIYGTEAADWTYTISY